MEAITEIARIVSVLNSDHSAENVLRLNNTLYQMMMLNGKKQIGFCCFRSESSMISYALMRRLPISWKFFALYMLHVFHPQTKRSKH